jgi:hypothetical protein
MCVTGLEVKCGSEAAGGRGGRSKVELKLFVFSNIEIENEFSLNKVSENSFFFGGRQVTYRLL